MALSLESGVSRARRLTTSIAVPQPSIHAAVVAAMVALAGFFNLWRLSQNGYGNPYYAAAVRSMTDSWHNFFFAAYDPGGFITVDKPPVALWIQAISARIFGYSGMSLLVPEALFGVGTVVIIYLAVSRVFGRWPGVVSGVVLAVTPVSVAISRTNNLDAALIFFVTAAAYAAVRALEKGGWRWLLLAAVCGGIAFNTKFMAGYIAMPALWLAYLVTAPISIRSRLRDTTIAGFLLLAVSGAWMAAVDLTPASSRPYVGGSTENSEFNLAIDYNGLGRINNENSSGGGNAPAQSRSSGGDGSQAATPQQGSRTQPQRQDDAGTTSGQTGAVPDDGANTTRGGGTNGGSSGGVEGGQPGRWRIFEGTIASQIAWFIPFAAVGGVVAAAASGRKLHGNAKLGSVILWGGWLLVAAAVFSKAGGTFHPYYVALLAPPIAALAGAGLAGFTTLLRGRPWPLLVAPVALIGTALLERRILAGSAAYATWTNEAVLIAAIAGSIAALAVFFTSMSSLRVPKFAPSFVLSLAIGGLLLPLLAWSYSVAAEPGNGRYPVASPLARNSNDLSVDENLIAYLQENQGDTEYLLATENSMNASPIIITTGESVLPLAGYRNDSVLDTAGLAALVESNTVRYFLVGGQTQASSNGLSSAITSTCTAVPAATYGGSQASSALYDCVGKSAAIATSGSR